MGNQGEEQEGNARAIDLVVAGQDTGRDRRRSNRNGEVTTSTGKTIGKRRDVIGTTRREAAGGKHKGLRPQRMGRKATHWSWEEGYSDTRWDWYKGLCEVLLFWDRESQTIY